MTSGLTNLAQILGDALPGDVADDLWRLVHTRGHVDLAVARPSIDRSFAGTLVYARVIDERRALLVVDGGERLIAVIGRFPAIPRVASAVRLIGSYDGEGNWRLAIDEPFRLAAQVRFERQPAHAAERHWLESLRNALALIRAAESERRDRLAQERRALPPLAADTAVEVLLRERTETLRRDAALRSEYTRAERLELAEARASRTSPNPMERRRGLIRENALTRARQARFDDAVAERMTALRDAAPSLRDQATRVAARNRATRDALARIESAYADSLARSATAYGAVAWIAALESAPFVIDGLETPPAGLHEPGRAAELLRAISLLVRALPRTRALIAV
jgi:hypothetical protein